MEEEVREGEASAVRFSHTGHNPGTHLIPSNPKREQENEARPQLGPKHQRPSTGKVSLASDSIKDIWFVQ